MNGSWPTREHKVEDIEEGGRAIVWEPKGLLFKNLKKKKTLYNIYIKLLMHHFYTSVILVCHA